MDEVEDFIPISALQHFLYCPRQCALIHLEQQWAESRHTAEGRLLHRRVDEAQMRRRPAVRSVTGMPLVHPGLRITGVADLVEFRQVGAEEEVWPVEYKRGRPKAHRADEVQLCAQALCLEHMLGRTIRAGELFYGQPRRRTEVLLDADLRQLTMDTIAQTQAMFSNGRTPSATYVPRRCDACSLMDLCQPKLLQRSISVARWLAASVEH